MNRQGGKERNVNARFEAMCGHYLFEPEFCNRASGWEKGIVEKNVQDRRRQLWIAAADVRWVSLAQLNDWLAENCRQAWEDMAPPDWPEMKVVEVLQDERLQLMPVPKPFDSYVEQPVRASSTSLIHFQKNRYSVPTTYAHRVVSLHIYPTELVVVADSKEIARHERVFERYVTRYDWQHYLPLIAPKPGALRNGASFQTMPEPLLHLQRHLLKHPGGGRVMVQVLSVISDHGLGAVLDAVSNALESGRPSGEHVLNVLGRIKQIPAAESITTTLILKLKEEPQANVSRYERLRSLNKEMSHVA